MIILEIFKLLIGIIIIGLLYFLYKKPISVINDRVMEENIRMMEDVKIEIERAGTVLDTYQSDSRIKLEENTIDNTMDLDKLKAMRRK